MKLNIGAGHDIYDGWINHDIAVLPGIDVVHDLNLTPWPWNDESMDEVVAYDVIEHLDDFIKIMEELWRVMAVGGRAKIRVPYMGAGHLLLIPLIDALFMNQPSCSSTQRARCVKSGAITHMQDLLSRRTRIYVHHLYRFLNS